MSFNPRIIRILIKVQVELVDSFFNYKFNLITSITNGIIFCLIAIKLDFKR